VKGQKDMTGYSKGNQFFRLWALLMPAVLVAGCTQGPDYQRPEIQMPAEFRSPTSLVTASSLADLAWWDVFKDPVLKGIINEALANNLDIQVAAARVEQARALVGVAKSQALPQIGYQAGGSANGSYLPLPSGADSVTYAEANAGLGAVWELDIWGRIKRSTEAARARLLAEEDVRKGVLLSLVSDVATAYFDMLSLDRQIAIAVESAKVYRENVDFYTLRFDAGRDTRLPVERARANYAASLERIADLKKRVAQQENILSVLVGGYPKSMPRGLPLTAQTMPQTPVGATTALLQRRPDIQRAEQMMVNANAEVGVAAADYFPRIGLSAFVGGQGVTISNAVDASFGIWNVAGTLAGPIFSGGRLRATEANRKAYWDETVAAYKKTILVAFQETSDELAAQKGLAEQRVALEAQVAALQRAVDLAQLRFDAGRANYFEVLEAEQQLFPAQYQLARAQRDQLVTVVNLYKALGGGWQLTPETWSQNVQGN
jgi:multidrug efflux system outer membrane protein